MKWYHWSVPLLLCLAGYFAASAGRPVAQEAAVATRAADRRAEAVRSDVAAAIGEFNQEWEAAQKQAAAENAAMSVEDLRAKIVKLKQALDAMTEDTDWEIAGECQQRMFAAAGELGRRQGEEAVQWLKTLDRDLASFAMDGWAKVEPEAAFKAIIASEHRGPCSGATLMELLQGKAGAGSAALKQACGEVPWELFRDVPGADPFGNNGLEIPKDADVRPWIESGAARELAGQGVGLANLFSLWAKQDTEGALIQSLDWPGPGDSPALFVLGVGLDDPERAEQIRALLEALPAEQLSKVTEAVSKFRERRTQFGDNVVKTFPMLDSTKEGEEEP
ncbi:hypothetical protein [Luteolibacter sp. Populi]|uniref:hypothetical protein n=1 Tax=Luteolibacter sp. Populi TaxID=3230487 RepID=UPI0034666CB9